MNRKHIQKIALNRNVQVSELSQADPREHQAGRKTEHYGCPPRPFARPQSLPLPPPLSDHFPDFHGNRFPSFLYSFIIVLSLHP